jgi:hypothetical protein
MTSCRIRYPDFVTRGHIEGGASPLQYDPLLQTGYLFPLTIPTKVGIQGVFGEGDKGDEVKQLKANRTFAISGK